MSPRWLHWPVMQVAPNWRLDALCGTKDPTNRYMTLTSPVETGETANFTPYGIDPLRNTGGSFTYIEFMLIVESGGAYSSANDFLASTTNRTYLMSVDGSVLSHTSVTEVGGTGTLCRIRLNAATAVCQAFWNDLDTGDAFVFTISYD